MKKRSLYLVLPVISLILELLPYGAVIRWAHPEGAYQEYYSYFAVRPARFANITPLITAAITCVVLLLLVLYCITNKQRLARKARDILRVGSFVSLGPMLMGFRYVTVVGMLITASLFAEWMLLDHSKL